MTRDPKAYARNANTRPLPPRHRGVFCASLFMTLAVLLSAAVGLMGAHAFVGEPENELRALPAPNSPDAARSPIGQPAANVPRLNTIRLKKGVGPPFLVASTLTDTLVLTNTVYLPGLYLRTGILLDIIPDTSHAVTQTVSTKGGAVVASAADGTQFTLDILADALLQPTVITMTPLLAADHLPLSGGLVSGVDLGPDDLLFLRPAILTAELPDQAGFTPGIGFSYLGAGSGFQLYPSVRDAATYIFLITHLSGYGIGAGTPDDLAALLNNPPPSVETRALQELAAIASSNPQQLCSPAVQDAMREIFARWYHEAVLPSLGEAVAAAAGRHPRFEEVFRRAIGSYLSWLAQQQLLCMSDDPILQDLAAAYERRTVDEFSTVVDDHNNVCASSEDFCREKRVLVQHILLIDENLQLLFTSWRLLMPASICGGYLTQTVGKTEIMNPDQQLDVGESVQLTAIVKNQLGSTITDPPHAEGVFWSSSDSFVASVAPDTGQVIAYEEGTAQVKAWLKQCDNEFQDSVNVTVQDPSEYVIQARLADCDWNARFCQFPSISAPVPLAVRVGKKIDSTIVWQANVQVQVDIVDKAEADPATGMTDSNGQFISTVTGVVRKSPYIIAIANALVDGESPQVVASAISSDICEGDRHGTDSWTNVGTVQGNYEYQKNLDVDYKYLSGWVSSSATCPSLPDVYQPWQSQVNVTIFGEWWDTIQIIPSDLALLGERLTLVLDVNADLDGDASTHASLPEGAQQPYGYAGAQVQVLHNGLYAGSCYGRCEPDGPYEWSESTVELSSYELQVGEPFTIGDSGYVSSSSSAWGYPDNNGGHYSSDASSRASLTANWQSISEVRLQQSSSPLLDFYFFSCSARLSLKPK